MWGEGAGGYGVFDDWLGGRIELFALALKVKRERGGDGCCFKVKTKKNTSPSCCVGKMVVENDQPTDREVEVIT